MTKITTWHGCYDGDLKALIVPEAFAHPAKLSRKLCERIFDHGQERGYWSPGDIILDPFYGIGTVGLVGAYRGYQVIGVELEEKFVQLAEQSIEKNRRKLERLGSPLPQVIQGDSRELVRLVGEAVGGITSPPYATKVVKPRSEHLEVGRLEAKGLTNQRYGLQAGGLPQEEYGYTEGQLSQMPEGDFAGAISSPPYADMPTYKNSDSIHIRKQFETYRNQGGGQSFEAFEATQKKHSQGYGGSEGQLGNLPEGELQGAITSPPYMPKDDRRSPWGGDHDALNERDRELGYLDSEGGQFRGAYSNNPDNIGNPQGVDAANTYWQACAQIYRQVFQLLPPGGAFAVVVKDFVRDKKRVPLCDQTAELLEATGFEVVERVHAMLVKEEPLGIDMFNGEMGYKRTERKSFFRRLAEKKGSPRIDYEEVIWAVKPEAPGGAADV